MSITLTLEQTVALDAIVAWLKPHRRRKARPAPHITLGGYAGTGKTTVIRALIDRIREELSLSPTVCAPTGKAAHVLNRKGVFAATIHSTIYTPTRDENGKISFELVPFLDADYIICDEGSMISTDLWSDLCSFGKPIIVVGDHGQLEPVGDNPKLLLTPDLRLETIMRQALTNPIIALAHRFRTEEDPWSQPRYDYTEDNSLGYSFHQGFDSLPFTPDIIITPFNKERVLLNKLFRENMRDIRSAEPIVGDRIICLRNDAEKNIFNGMMGTIHAIKSRDAYTWELEFLPDGAEEPIECRACKFQFNRDKPPGDDTRWGVQYFDFAYAITCHKAQGSEWDNVCVMERQCKLWSMPRWRYTAATRAARRLAYIC